MPDDPLTVHRHGVDTGLVDSEGRPIHCGDWVAIDAITADDSMGHLPNGFMFDADEDVYQVWWDDRCEAWGLKLDVEPDTDYNRKYTNHAYGCLHDPICVTRVDAPHGK